MKHSRFLTLGLFIVLCLLQEACLYDATPIISTNKPATFSSICGNGLFEDGEECDDGNFKQGDGCSQTCKKELGWKCFNRLGTLSQCSKIVKCALRDGSCLDGNKEDGDGCNSKCEIEPGWLCRPCSSSNCSVCEPICGDGLLQKGEQCDYSCQSEIRDCLQTNGNDKQSTIQCMEKSTTCYPNPYQTCDCEHAHNFEDCLSRCFLKNGCTPNCTQEFGWNCQNKESSFTCESPKCGDGIIALGKEECDDGNQKNGDGCSRECKIETSSPQHPWSCSDFIHNPQNFFAQITYRDKPNLKSMKTIRQPPGDTLSDSGKPIFEQKVFNEAFTDLPKENAIKDIIIFNLGPVRAARLKDRAMKSTAQMTHVERSAPEHFNPFYKRKMPNGSINEDFLKEGFSTELKVNFVFNQDIIGPANALTLGGDDAIFVFINKKLAFSRIRNGEGSLTIKGMRSEKNGPLINTEFGMKENGVYEMAIFHLNLEGPSSFTISLPSTVIGPSFCERCGNGFVNTGTNEQCDDGNNNNWDGCSSDCKFEFGYTCDIDYSSKSQCSR